MNGKLTETNNIENIFLESNFKAMRLIQKNMLQKALKNFDEKVDKEEYMKLVKITKDVLGIEISLRKVILISYGDPFFHMDLVELGADVLKSEWFDSLSINYLNRKFPVYGDNLSEKEYGIYIDHLIESINKKV